jgi:hypothetical protein
MAKHKYEIAYYITNAAGTSKSGPITATVEAESETNALAELRKRNPDSKDRRFELVSLKQK